MNVVKKVPSFEPIKRSTCTVEEIAKYIGISKEQLYIIVRKKQIPHFRIGKKILFKREAVDKWIESQMVDSTGEEDYI